MEQTSIQSETMASIKTAIMVPMTAIIATAKGRFILNLVCKASIGASNRLMSEVRPANRTAIKNITMTNAPPGIPLNTWGR